MVHVAALSSQVSRVVIPIALQANQVTVGDVSGLWVENVHIGLNPTRTLLANS
jgi:hypothetical protein